MEVEAPASGVIRDLNAALDVPLPVGSIIAWIDAAGEGERKTTRSASNNERRCQRRRRGGAR